MARPPAIHVHSYHSQKYRGFNNTSPAHRAELILTLRAMQALEGVSNGNGMTRIAPSIVGYCDSVLAPYVAAYRHSHRRWEGLRAFEADEADHRRPYVAGFGVETWKKRITRAWDAA